MAQRELTAEMKGNLFCLLSALKDVERRVAVIHRVLHDIMESLIVEPPVEDWPVPSRPTTGVCGGFCEEVVHEGVAGGVEGAPKKTQTSRSESA